MAKRARRDDNRLIVWRNGRAYGDFRAYEDVGGTREALSEPGKTWGTKDGQIAEVLYDARLEELKAKRKNRVGVEERRHTTLAKLVKHHLLMEPSRAGITIEGDPDDPDGRSVETSRPSGGRSDSGIDGEGAVTAELTAPLDVGRPNEVYVLDLLAKALLDEGRDCFPCENAFDERGEDGALLVDGERVPLQVITVPSDSGVWRDLVQDDTTSIKLHFEQVVEMVHSSIERKGDRSELGAIVALDASHIGAAVGQRLVQGYLAAQGDPADRSTAVVHTPAARSTNLCASTEFFLRRPPRTSANLR